MTLIKTMTLIHCLAISAMMVAIPAQAGEQEPVVEAFFSDEFPVHGRDELVNHGIEVRLYNLDDSKRLTSSLAVGLPPNQEQAKAALEQRFKNQGMDAVRNQFAQAFQGMIVGTQYGLDRYPAIVFDRGRAVVYGETDLVQALESYRQWQRKNP